MSAPITHSGVLVGVDGSPAARCAVDWAARDAAMRNVPLTLVHAVQPLGPRCPADGHDGLLALASRAGQKILDGRSKPRERRLLPAARRRSRPNCCSHRRFRPWSTCPKTPIWLSSGRGGEGPSPEACWVRWAPASSATPTARSPSPRRGPPDALSRACAGSRRHRRVTRVGTGDRHRIPRGVCEASISSHWVSGATSRSTTSPPSTGLPLNRPPRRSSQSDWPVGRIAILMSQFGAWSNRPSDVSPSQAIRIGRVGGGRQPRTGWIRRNALGSVSAAVAHSARMPVIVARQS